MRSEQKIQGKIKGNAFRQVETVKDFIAVRGFDPENKTLIFMDEMCESIIALPSKYSQFEGLRRTFFVVCQPLNKKKTAIFFAVFFLFTVISLT